MVTEGRVDGAIDLTFGGELTPAAGGRAGPSGGADVVRLAYLRPGKQGALPPPPGGGIGHPRTPRRRQERRQAATVRLARSVQKRTGRWAGRQDVLPNKGDRGPAGGGVGGQTPGDRRGGERASALQPGRTRADGAAPR